ncbi:MAG: hypothetical protein Q9209_007165 [Squamulea sp. 1 TL-2023]
MESSNNTVSELLKSVSRLSNSAMEPCRADAIEAFETLRQFVEGPRPSISALITTLNLNSAEVKDFLRAEPDLTQRTGFTDILLLSNEDPRVFDLQVNKKSPDVKFRKGLSQISLASAYSAWEEEQEKRRETTVDALVREPSALEKRKRLYIKEFLDSNTDLFKNQRVALDGIKHGIKCLVFQKLFGYNGVLAILGFVYHQFRSVNFEELQDLRDELVKISWVLELAKSKTIWYEGCQRTYEGITSRSG